jgi:hypothetical protein
LCKTFCTVQHTTLYTIFCTTPRPIWFIISGPFWAQLITLNPLQTPHVPMIASHTHQHNLTNAHTHTHTHTHTI